MKANDDIRPPRWPQYILRFFLKEEYAEEIEGDLEELFRDNLNRYQASKAKRIYILEMLRLVRPALAKDIHFLSFSIYIAMIKNYFKIAFRTILRHKAFSFINIAGLAVGMACSIIIMLWVQNERSYDTFHNNASQLYRLTCSAGDFKAAVSAAGIAEGLQAVIPEIAASTKLSKPITALLEAGDKKFEEKKIFFADSNFLQLFSFPLLKGNAATALANPGNMLLTEEMAKKYFGSTDAIGKTIRVNNKESFIVTGILASPPSNSHIQFDLLFSMATIRNSDSDLRDKVWDKFNYYSYLQFKAGLSNVAVEQLTPRIQEIYKQHNSKDKIDLHLQPVTAIHLQSDLQIDLPGHGNAQYVNIFFIVSILIIIVACINFMNLATARSVRRAKEVGMRKVAGAGRVQLILQFLGESLIVSFLSLFVALAIIYLMMPAFNNLTGSQVVFELSAKNIISLISIAFITGIIAGSYPALVLSSFRPVTVLKGKLIAKGNKSLFRNSLVVAQFTVAIILLAGTAVVYQQLNFIKNKNLGFDKSNLLYLPMTGDLWNKQDLLKDELQQNPLTTDFSIVSELPTALTSGTINVEWEGRDPKSQVVIPSIDVDENFIDVFRMQIIAGRGFSSSFKADSANYVINEKAMQLMGFNTNNVAGKSLGFGGQKGTIVGVVKDFNFKPLQYGIEPLVLRLNRWGGTVMIRTKPGTTETTIKSLEKISRDLNPSYPLSYGFLNNDLDQIYRGEQQMGKIFNLFTILAIFISCLGLYGLSAYMAEQRTREIGVRKVLGASVMSILLLLSGNFTKLVLLAIVIAVPLSWYGIYNWLNGFAYRVEINWTIFAVASLIALGIAWLTMSYESIKAASANPARSLKSE